jgi:hypothetical protein
VIRRAVLLALALAVGMFAGAIGGLAVQDDARLPPAAPTTTASPPSTRLEQHDGGVLLVWTRARLATGLAERVARTAGVVAVAAVRAGTLGLTESRRAGGELVDTVPAGWSIPLDVIGVDPATYAAFLPAGGADAVRRLEPGRALLGTTSAALRRLGPGGSITLGELGVQEVDAVIDDQLVGAAELVIHHHDPAAATLEAERYLLVRYRGARTDVERAVRAAVDTGVPVRFRAPGETPYLRDGDAVLPQARIKERFGEFAVRPLADGRLELDAAWIADRVIGVDLPLVGAAQCHRALVPALAGALREVEQANLAHLVDPAGFGGCWVPRYIDGTRRISRHAWGAAVDLNTLGNPTGLATAQDARLVEIMRRWGFTSGAGWLLPDPAHFEYVRPARA